MPKRFRIDDEIPLDGYLELLARDERSVWHDTDVPLERRGIRGSWLWNFVWAIVQSRYQMWNSYEARVKDELRHAQYSYYDYSFEPPERPQVYAPRTMRELVAEYIIPVTQSLQAPLYALVPEEECGIPTCFISHAWDAGVIKTFSGSFGSCDILREKVGSEFVWMDIACYNQHTHESIARDMEFVIGAIGKVVFSMADVPLFNRIWCLWEFLCGTRVTGGSVDFFIPGAHRDTMSALASTHVRDYTTVEDAKATKPEDYDEVLAAILSHFGSVEAADKHLRGSLLDKYGYLAYWHQQIPPH